MIEKTLSYQLGYVLGVSDSANGIQDDLEMHEYVETPDHFWRGYTAGYWDANLISRDEY